MPPAKQVPLPTDGELEILAVLWKRGPSTVRAVHQELSAERDIGYTTVLKLLQIMLQKGIVARDDSAHAHIYRPAQAAERTERSFVASLLNRAFGGSTSRLVIQALSAKRTTRAELAEIRRVLDEMEKDP
jgi:predicted transcriptional regulator